MLDVQGIPPLEGDEEEDGEGDEDGSDGSDYDDEYAEEA